MWAAFVLGILIAFAPALIVGAIFFSIAVATDRGGWFFAGVLACVLILAGGGFAFDDWHDNETSHGIATGYVSAVQTGGVFWSTTTVYLKTDLQSTQEEAYCVVDLGLAQQLRQSAERRQRVELTFTGHLWFGEGCEFDDGDTITAVRAIAGA
jgi:hypothetical protein